MHHHSRRFNRISNAIITVVVLSLQLANAETHITGDISEMTLESSGNPYIVEQDLLVPEEKKAIIGEGCVFLFKPFTGLTVHGNLFVDGTQEQPVIFTSINDGEYNTASEQLPNPFDWNGECQAVRPLDHQTHLRHHLSRQRQYRGKRSGRGE